MPPFEDRSLEVDRIRKELHGKALKLFMEKVGMLAGLQVKRENIEPLIVTILTELSAKEKLGEAIYIGLKNELITNAIAELSTDKKTGMEKYEPMIEITKSAPTGEVHKQTNNDLLFAVKDLAPEKLKQLRGTRFDLREDDEDK